MATGASTVIAGQQEHHDPMLLWKCIHDNTVSVLPFTSSALELFIDTLASKNRGLPSSIQLLLIGGENLSTELTDKLRISDPKGTVQAFNLYGPTETTVQCATYQCTQTEKFQSVPIGTPVSNTQLYVLDACGHPLPKGIPGELHVAGQGLAKGYLNNPGKTADVFVTLPQVSNDRLYRTGDRALWLESGNLLHIGRMDTQVKIRGQRVELDEIIRQLESLETVGKSVVLPFRRKGSNQEGNSYDYLVAWYTGSVQRDQEWFREQLSQYLPACMIPASFIWLDTLPLTANGKLDHKALPEPELTSPLTYVPPTNDTEQYLCTLWQELLQIEQVGIDDNF
ncbi:AMP-binding protein, partial [Sansalvadorimonas verongulae]|uniref:AMP-binding protein n=1 Tax=Sansalvadorimonas verongulae TaxID=2172824 RepID=UPI0012BCC9E2